MSVAAKDRLDQEIQARSNRGLLRFITCGSVDDGKSTLIGRLLYDSKLLLSDQIEAIRRPENEVGFSFSSLVDGLEAEQEQGITIDVAYRYFATTRRNFIVADTPGHEQYTRNMATGASTAELAILLVDARKGILPQTRRHAYIVSLLGIRDVVLAVNKMDLCDYAEGVFDEICDAFAAFAEKLNIQTVQAIPMSALKGDNIVDPGAHMPWYDGPPLMKYLEEVRPAGGDAPTDFRFPVQWVNRPDQDFRGLSGSVASGKVCLGDEIVVLPSGVLSRLERIVTFDGDRDEAGTGEAVTLVLADDVDVSRGDIICPRRGRASISDQFEVKLIWMSDTELLPGRSYILKAGAQSATASVTKLKYRININSLEHEAARTLKLNEIAECTISLDRLLAYDPYSEIPATGSFILIDKENNGTVAAGLIEYGLMRASNIHWQATEVSKSARADLKGQRPCVIWFTGLSGSGKSTIANLLEKRLSAAARHSYLLDGDNVRHGLNRDLGFTDADRVENIRRVGEVAKLFVESGMIVLVSFISPFRSERRMARDLVEAGEFVEIFVDAPIEVCEARDTKGLYAKARAGEIKNFTGFDSPYEKPKRAELTLDTAALSAEESVEQIIDYLRDNGFVDFD